MARQRYTLTVKNNSPSVSTFAVFAHLPESADNDALDLAWQVRPINTDTESTFTWYMQWGFAWAAQTTSVDGTWASSQKATGDPTDEALCAKDLTWVNEAFAFGSTTHEPAEKSNKLYVLDDSNIPSSQPVSVGATLDGSPVIAVNGGPGLTQTFTLHPTYYISGGDYAVGQMADGASVSDFYELDYEDTQHLTVTLSDKNKWSGVGDVVADNV